MSEKTIPIYSLVAWSDTGKTTYLEKLVPCLKRFGLRVAVVKHDGHDFEIDHRGTDTARFSDAGADVSAILSATHGAILYNVPMTPEAFVEQIEGVDLIITEGFKSEKWRKLLLYRRERGGEPAVDPNGCFAVITDTPLNTDTPQFGLDEPEKLARTLYEAIRGGRSAQSI